MNVDDRWYIAINQLGIELEFMGILGCQGRNPGPYVLISHLQTSGT
jgi:hypothetical protein